MSVVSKVCPKRLCFLYAFLILLSPCWNAANANAAKALSIGLPGAALLDPFTLNAGIPILNRGKATASNVEIASITLTGGATLTAPALPFSLGSVTTLASGGGMTPLFADFTSPNATLVPGADYILMVSGTYQIGTTMHAFTASQTLHIPEDAPGSATSNTASAAPHPPEGPFTPIASRFTETEANIPSSIEPIGPFVPVTPSNAIQLLDAGAGMQGPNIPAGTVTIPVNRGLGAGLFKNPRALEPSGASVFEPGGNVVFITANSAAVYSTDGGSSFSSPLNPTTMFKNPWDGGYGCDQIVQYVPSIDRFVWIMQTFPQKIAKGKGPNRLRLAIASPSDIATNARTAWTYWDLISNVTFGFPNDTHLDYPDLAVGNNDLYVSVDQTKVGFFVMRIPLSELLAGGTINFRYTHPEHGKPAVGGHLTQSPGDTIFWAGHIHTSKLRVFSWPEGSNVYSWTDVPIESYNNTNLSSPAGGCDWMHKLGSFGTAVRGATRSGNDLWLAWGAGSDSNFPQPHIEMVDLDISNNFSLKQQVQIWTADRSFAYPALATAATGEIGFAFEHGGPGLYENHAVGFWGDSIAYITTHSTAGTNRYGDYVTIRQNPTAKGFDAFGYEVLTSNSSCTTTSTNVHYVVFGRP